MKSKPSLKPFGFECKNCGVVGSVKIPVWFWNNSREVIKAMTAKHEHFIKKQKIKCKKFILKS
jgi:hypothetical protein